MVALLALASSLAHAQGIDVEATKRALRMADLELAKAVADRSLQTFVSLVDDDAVFFGKDVARGKNAVSKAWLPFFSGPDAVSQVVPDAGGDLRERRPRVHDRGVRADRKRRVGERIDGDPQLRLDLAQAAGRPVEDRPRHRDSRDAQALKIATWNVNGIRARETEVLEWIDARAARRRLPAGDQGLARRRCRAALCELQGYWCYWHGDARLLRRRAARAPGRVRGASPSSRTPRSTTRTAIVAAELGRPDRRVDLRAQRRQGLPRQDALPRGDGRLGGERARAGRQLVLCGDLNVARTERDVHPKERKPTIIGQRPEERALFERHPRRAASSTSAATLDPDNDGLFTWWAPWRNMRQRNIGWRLDYVLASEPLAAPARALRGAARSSAPATTRRWWRRLRRKPEPRQKPARRRGQHEQPTNLRAGTGRERRAAGEARTSHRIRGQRARLASGGAQSRATRMRGGKTRPTAELALTHRKIAEDLRAMATRMAGYRDLAMASTIASDSSPKAVAAFERVRHPGRSGSGHVPAETDRRPRDARPDARGEVAFRRSDVSTTARPSSTLAQVPRPDDRVLDRIPAEDLEWNAPARQVLVRRTSFDTSRGSSATCTARRSGTGPTRIRVTPSSSVAVPTESAQLDGPLSRGVAGNLRRAHSGRSDREVPNAVRHADHGVEVAAGDGRARGAPPRTALPHGGDARGSRCLRCTGSRRRKSSCCRSPRPANQASELRPQDRHRLTSEADPVALQIDLELAAAG